MNTEHANPALFAALAKAQGEVENATKGSVNPAFKGAKYADLAEVLNTIRPVFSKNGLSVIQSTAFDGAMVHVHTVLCHADGGFITATASCVPAKTDAQGVGSATTYLRRYSAAAMAGVAQEDDDGNSAAHSKPPEPAFDMEPWLAAIDDATDADALAEVGTKLAAAKLPVAVTNKLRAAFAARRNLLAGGA